MGEFADAGLNLIRSLEQGLYDSAKEVMRESIQECPISGPDTYVPQVRTIGSGPGRRLMFLGDDPSMVGDNGTLRRSARVFPPTESAGRSTVTLGYGFGEEKNPAGRFAAEYAVPVHERSEIHHPIGKSHYLIDPLLAFATHFGERLARAAQERKLPSQGVFATIEGQDLEVQ